MKKTLLYVLTLLLVVSCAFSLVACGNRGNENTTQSENGSAEAPHTHTMNIKYDATGHWQECACGYKTEKSEHTLEVEYDAEGHMQECECGYMSAKAPHQIEYEFDEEGHWGECACGYKTAKAAHSLESAFSTTEQWEECLCGYETAKTPLEGYFAVTEAWGYTAEGFSVENFASSGKALSFEYKPVGDRIEGNNDYVTFSLMAGWDRLTDYISLNVLNDTIKSGIGKVEDLGDDWKKVTINIYEMTIGGDEHATADQLYFHWVNHGFLIKNVAFAAEYRKATEVDKPWGNGSLANFSVEEFAFSDKALSFEYKPVESDLNKGNTVRFSLMANWTRLTNFFTLDVVNNTLAGGIGNIEEVGEGWMKVTINISEMTLNTADAYVVTGKETADLIYFDTVDHVFLLDKLAFADQYRKPIKISAEAGYSALGFTLENFATSGKALSFEYKPTGDRIAGGDDYVTFSLMSGWDRKIGYISVEVVADNIASGIGQIEDIGEGWRRVTVNCSEMTLDGADGSETLDRLYFQWVNHGFYIANVKFTDEYRKATAVDAAWNYSAGDFTVVNFATSGKALTFEYKAFGDRIGKSENDHVGFSLMTGWTRRTEYFAIDVVKNEFVAGTGTIEDSGDGWYRVTMNFADMGINTGEGADGSETIDLIYFHAVNHGFLIANIAIVDAA